MERRILIDTRNYPKFWIELQKIPGMRNPGSKRNLRRGIRSHFFLDVHHKRHSGIKILFLSESDAITFKLKFS